MKKPLSFTKRHGHVVCQKDHDMADIQYFGGMCRKKLKKTIKAVSGDTTSGIFFFTINVNSCHKTDQEFEDDSHVPWQLVVLTNPKVLKYRRSTR